MRLHSSPRSAILDVRAGPDRRTTIPPRGPLPPAADPRKDMLPLHPTTHRSGPTRRRFGQLGGLAALRLLWGDWLRADAAGVPPARGRARSVILIFNCGAPSH